MSLFQRGADTFYAYRFIRLLVTKWEDTEAFKVGILDNKGKRIKTPVTSEEKSAYTYFHRLVFNIKRLMEKAPGGRTRLASFLAALYLIRESKSLGKVFDREIVEFLDLQTDKKLNEWFCSGSSLRKGTYTFTSHVLSETTGEFLPMKGRTITLTEDLPAHDEYLGIRLFKAYYENFKQSIIFTIDDIVP